MNSITKISGCFWLCISMVVGFAQTSSQHEVKISETSAVYGFYEYLPEGYGEDTRELPIKKYPLLVFLHGRGETGDGDADLYKLKNIGPHRLIAEGRQFPAIVLAPQSRDTWNVDSLDTFIDWAIERYHADTARVYITGLSMGGAGTWLYAVAHPEKLAAIVPIAGDSHAKQPEKLVQLPVWAFHNRFDHIVEVERTIGWIEGIERAGGNPHLTIYEDSAHDSWTRTYNNDSVWNWMFAQGPVVEPEPEPLANKPIDEINVFPNPFTDEFTITGSVADITANLYDLQGHLVAQWSTFERVEKGTTLQIPGLRAGMYLLELTSPHQTRTIKLLKR